MTPARAPTRVAIVTNIPAPYRVPVYELLAAEPGLSLKVFFCSAREPDRAWDVASLRVQHAFLRERVLRWSRRYIHANPDVWRHLSDFAPQVVVTTGFNPTHLLAFLHAHLRGARHVAMTDGTADSERGLTALHCWLRRRVYRRTQAFVGASDGSRALFRQYGVADDALFRSPLCADNDAFMRHRGTARDVDLVFCGRFVPGKLPLFAIDVALATAQRLDRRIVLLLIGAGELEDEMRRRLAGIERWVAARFAGFARQCELPGHYARARVALFPTLGDTWGVVANEACAAGVPVITSPEAGAAGELVRDGDNGRVLPCVVAPWADAAVGLLRDASSWQRMSNRSIALVANYRYTDAARGLAAAVRHAMSA